jgi:hypothetical protein
LLRSEARQARRPAPVGQAPHRMWNSDARDHERTCDVRGRSDARMRRNRRPSAPRCGSCGCASARGRRSPRRCATSGTRSRSSPAARRPSRPRWRCASPGLWAYRWTSYSRARGCRPGSARTAATRRTISSTKTRSPG